MKVNIITPFNNNEFSKQLPIDSIKGIDFYENGDLNLDYDLIVVYEDVRKPITVKVRKSNIIFISGEPPASRMYTKHFLSQFNYVISSHKYIKHPQSIQNQQALPWHFGFDYKKRSFKYDYEQLKNLDFPIKKKKISIIASNKKMMPGHRKRLKFIKELQLKFGNEIDFYGKGINPINDKSDAILPYYMTICIENSSIDNYWTEKIADAYLGFSLPIYTGCTNISDYFPKDSFEILDITNKSKAFEKIRYLLDNTEKIYELQKQSIYHARALLLDKYNIYFYLEEFIKTYSIVSDSHIAEHLILPNHQTDKYKISLYKLKFKRFLKRVIL